MKYARTALLSAVISLGYISSAQALCYFSSTSNTPTTGNHFIYTPHKKITTFYGDPASVPIGKAFGTIQMFMQSNARFPNSNTIIFCGGGSNVLQQVGIGNPINNDIYPSNLPGIGYKISIFTYPLGHPNRTPITYPRFTTNTTGYVRPAQFEVLVTLIRTGQITCTGPFTGTFAQDMMDGQILGELRF